MTVEPAYAARSADPFLLRTSRALPQPAQRTGRLIVVSNRVALPDQSQAGGLGQALRALLAERGGIWVGWSGRTSAIEDVHSEHVGRVEYRTLDFPAEEFDEYYKEYANRALWPLLHGRTELVAHSERARRAYLAINARFADRLAAELNPTDSVWVQDYHLMPLARLLRDRGVRSRIGFFLHTPMPALEVFARMPDHRELLEALATYDVVGVQTEPDKAALQHSLLEVRGGAAVGADLLSLGNGHRITVKAFPIGVDVAALEKLAERAVAEPAVEALRESLGERALMIGVDRLDYSKGLPERIAAVQRLLDQAPEWHRRLTFLQIAPESRADVPEYRRLSRSVQRRVGRINGRHGDESWTPLRYVNRTYSQAELAGFYRIAKVGVVTPLRDGMNLVAKEFIACQNAADPGVLVLSQFAGAARELDSALQVDPFDVHQCADALQRALEMPLGERRERWQSAMHSLRASTIHDWGRRFMAALEVAPKPAAVATTLGQRVARLARLQQHVRAAELRGSWIDTTDTGLASAMVPE
jgi:trehalose 6-phosphate synthase